MMLIILMLVSIANAVDDHRPDWVRDHPLGYTHRFIVGSDYADGYGEAREKAYQNALQRLLEESGIHVDPLVSRVDESDGGIHTQSTLTYRTNAMSIDSLRVVDEYQHSETVLDRMGKAQTVYECHMLLRCLRKEPQSKPRPVTLVLGSVVLPGSSHIRIGVNTRGRWILERSCLLLAGAVGTWLAADYIPGRAHQLRSTSVVLITCYGLFGIGSAFDVVNSRYLVEYD